MEGGGEKLKTGKSTQLVNLEPGTKRERLQSRTFSSSLVHTKAVVRSRSLVISKACKSYAQQRLAGKRVWGCFWSLSSNNSS